MPLDRQSHSDCAQAIRLVKQIRSRLLEDDLFKLPLVRAAENLLDSLQQIHLKEIKDYSGKP